MLLYLEVSIQRSKTTLSTRALLHLHWTVTEPDRKTTIKYEVGQYTRTNTDIRKFTDTNMTTTNGHEYKNGTDVPIKLKYLLTIIESIAHPPWHGQLLFLMEKQLGT